MSERQDHEISPLTEQPAGSPLPGEPVFLVVGELRRPHGVRGEILMEVITDFPERLKPGARVYVGPEHQYHQITSSRVHGRSLRLRFQGYNTPEAVGKLRNQLVYVRADDRPPLPEGEYYHHELLGLRVVEESGKLLGVLESIIDNPANDIYVVRSESGGEILLPAIDSVILDVDLDQGEIRVHLLPGLLPG